MRNHVKKFFVVFSVFLAVNVIAVHSKAAVVLTALEVGNDVLISGGGSLNTRGLQNIGPIQFISGGSISPTDAALTLSPGATTLDYYTGISGPASLGGGSFQFSLSGTGDIFGVQGTSLGSLGPGISIAPGYQSGDTLSATALYTGASFASLGLSPGSYTWSWSSDSFTLNVGTAVPIPAALWLFASALSLLIGLKHKQ